MKLKEYLNSFISRRKRNSSSKSHKTKSHHESISLTNCQQEIRGCEDTNEILIGNHQNRTQTLLNQHVQVVNAILGRQTYANPYFSCIHCRGTHRSKQSNLSLNRNHSSILETCNPECEYQHQTINSLNNNFLSRKVKQRSKIRTNPWIKTTRILQSKCSIYDSISSLTLTHSESFPPIISFESIHVNNLSNVILHQNDSKHGFSWSNSRFIDSSSLDSMNSEVSLLDERQRVQYTYHTEQYSHCQMTNLSDNKTSVPKSSLFCHQRSSNIPIFSSKKSLDRKYYSVSSLSRFINDYFLNELEGIIENEHLHTPQIPTQDSLFILPLDETNIKFSSAIPISSPKILRKTNSHAMFKQLEDDIQIIKNLNYELIEQISSFAIYPKEVKRQSIHEQVDQWIDECLTNSGNTSGVLYRTTYNRLSNIREVGSTHASLNDTKETSSVPKLQKQKETEAMTTLYISSVSPTKCIFSSADQSLPTLQCETMRQNFKSNECPF